MAIETPTEVLLRLREQAKRERLSRAQQPYQQFLAARNPADRATAFGAQIGTALAQAFTPEEDLEASPEVVQAQKRQQWLSVDPGNAEQIKANIKSAADAGDYDVANYLTDLYYKARTLDLNAQRTQADLQPKGKDPEYKSEIGKLIQDQQRAVDRGDTAAASEIQKKIEGLSRKDEAVSVKEQMETYDKTFANTFGLDLEKDLSHSETGPQFQNIIEAAQYRQEKAGEKLGDIRNDISKYFKYQSGFFKDDGIFLSDYATEQLKKGTVGMGRDSNNRLGLYKINKEGKPTGFITWIDDRFAE